MIDRKDNEGPIIPEIVNTVVVPEAIGSERFSWKTPIIGGVTGCASTTIIGGLWVGSIIGMEALGGELTPSMVERGQLILSAAGLIGLTSGVAYEFVRIYKEIRRRN